MEVKQAKTLDIQGLICPLPVLKARKTLQSMSPGERLRVVTTDPVSVIDIPHFCHDAGHHLISETEEAGVYCFEIEKGS